MVPRDGRLAALRQLLRYDTLSETHIALSQTLPSGPDDEVTFASFTECDFDGYSNFTDPPFSVPTLNGDNQGFSSTDHLIWTAGAGISAAQTIYAVYYYFTFVSAGKVLFWYSLVTPTVTLLNPGEIFERTVSILADDLPI